MLLDLFYILVFTALRFSLAAFAIGFSCCVLAPKIRRGQQFPKHSSGICIGFGTCLGMDIAWLALPTYTSCFLSLGLLIVCF